jgi:hypothetical protein
LEPFGAAGKGRKRNLNILNKKIWKLKMGTDLIDPSCRELFCGHLKPKDFLAFESLLINYRFSSPKFALIQNKRTIDAATAEIRSIRQILSLI